MVLVRLAGWQVGWWSGGKYSDMVILMIVVVRVFTKGWVSPPTCCFLRQFLWRPCTVGLDGQVGHGGQGIQDGRGDYSDCDGQSCLFWPGAEFPILLVVGLDGQDDHGGQGIQVAFFDQGLSFTPTCCFLWQFLWLALMVKMVMVVKVFKLPVFTRGWVSHRSATTRRCAKKRHQPWGDLGFHSLFGERKYLCHYDFYPGWLLPRLTFIQVDSYSAFFDNTGEEGAGSTGLAEMIEGTTEVLVVDVELASCCWRCCYCHRHWWYWCWSYFLPKLLSLSLVIFGTILLPILFYCFHCYWWYWRCLVFIIILYFIVRAVCPPLAKETRCCCCCCWYH